MPISLNRLTSRNQTRLGELDPAAQQAALTAAGSLALQMRGLGIDSALDLLWCVSAVVEALAQADAEHAGVWEAVRRGGLVGRNGSSGDGDDEDEGKG